MNFSGKEIRNLRQRLGWSAAEMARRLGCVSTMLAKWESGASAPDPETLNQLRYLHNYVDSYNDQIACLPLADKALEERRIAQLTHRDLLKDLQ